jgi:hypothetical protein
MGYRIPWEYIEENRSRSWVRLWLASSASLARTSSVLGMAHEGESNTRAVVVDVNDDRLD